MKTTTATKTPPASAITSDAWAAALLAYMKKPVNQTNIDNITRMIRVETSGNTAGFLRDNNPLNLNTYISPHGSLAGGHIVNEWGVNVQVFNTPLDGIKATAAQLLASPAISAVLSQSGPASMFGAALGQSAWKSGSYANSTTFSGLKPYHATGTGTLVSQPKGNPTGWFGQWIEPILNDPIPIPGVTKLPGGSTTPGGGVIMNAANAIPGVSGALSTASFLGKISNPTTLKNVGIFILGGVLIVGGTIIFVSQTKGAKALEKVE